MTTDATRQDPEVLYEVSDHIATIIAEQLMDSEVPGDDDSFRIQHEDRVAPNALDQDAESLLARGHGSDDAPVRGVG